MVYNEQTREVRLEGADREGAQQHLSSALAELGELARIMSKALGRSDQTEGTNAELRFIFKPDTWISIRTKPRRGLPCNRAADPGGHGYLV